MTEKYLWADYYKELAMRVLPYETMRKELLGQLVAGFDAVGVQLPDREKLAEMDDVDPFTVIGLCNREMDEEARVKVAGALQQALYVDVFLPESFEGIETFDEAFYEGNEPEELAVLWELFHFALVYDLFRSEDARANLEKYFALAVEIDGMDVEKVKMGIGWFLPELVG